MKDFSNKYFSLLTNEFAGINLTAIRDQEDFYNKQILDSILPLDSSEKFKEDIDNKKIVIDVGFGGGFPILPLAKILPDVKFVGLESKNKKVNVVTEIANNLDIKNVKLYHRRLEEIDFNIDCVIVSKAMTTIENFTELINISNKASIYFYKAKNFYELEGNFLKNLKQFEVIEEKSMTLLDGSERYLIGIRNKVPRGTFKNLVKLTDLLKN